MGPEACVPLPGALSAAPQQPGAGDHSMNLEGHGQCGALAGAVVGPLSSLASLRTSGAILRSKHPQHDPIPASSRWERRPHPAGSSALGLEEGARIHAVRAPGTRALCAQVPTNGVQRCGGPGFAGPVRTQDALSAALEDSETTQMQLSGPGPS